MHPSGVIPESAIMMADSDCPDWHATIMPQESIDEAWAVPLRRYLKKSSTESHCDQNFEGLRPELMAECTARLERTAS
jgi:hypothetical protein